MTLDLLTTYMEVEYPVVVRPDRCTDGAFCYVAEHPDLPGCAAHGDTIHEARELLEHARLAYLRHLVAKDRTPPMPSPFRPKEWQQMEVTQVDDNEIVSAA